MRVLLEQSTLIFIHFLVPSSCQMLCMPWHFCWCLLCSLSFVFATYHLECFGDAPSFTSPPELHASFALLYLATLIFYFSRPLWDTYRYAKQTSLNLTGKRRELRDDDFPVSILTTTVNKLLYSASRVAPARGTHTHKGLHLSHTHTVLLSFSHIHTSFTPIFISPHVVRKGSYIWLRYYWCTYVGFL